MSAIHRVVWLTVVSVIGVLGVGCNAFDAGPSSGGATAVEPRGGRDIAAPVNGASIDEPAGMQVTAGTGSIMGPPPDFLTPDQVPVDDSPVVKAASAPPPIEGGTLLVSADGRFAVATDPDRDRVVLVDLESRSVAHEVQLEAGDVPGRLVEDNNGRVHVVLRRAGAVVSIDLTTGALLERTEGVCGVPRGIDYRRSNNSVLVACAGGELVQLPASGVGITRVTRVEPDLQDVIVTGDDRVFASLFKRAELIEINSFGETMNRRVPDTLRGPFFGTFVESSGESKTLEPAVAWAALRGPDDSVVMVHQRAQTDTVEISHDDNPFADPGAGGYGGGFGPNCDGIVQNGVTIMGADGSVKSLPPIANLVLPVDGAVSPDGRWLAIGLAGQGEVGVLPDLFGGTASAVVIETQRDAPAGECQVPGIDSTGGIIGGGQTIGVAFDPQGRLITQSRDPNVVRVFSRFDNCGLNPCPPDFEVALGGEPMRDTGHDLFHINAGSGIACASCHPGGMDDGRTWVFSGLGPRRTQLFNMGIKDTEPLHWDGDMDTFDRLVGEVFVRRMGGAPQSAARVGAMADWIDSLEPHPPLRAASDATVLRGKELFESDEVGCAGCHSGELMTNNATVDVGTGGFFQVPSLVNVAYHQPFIHTGCAETLRERFDASCGGGDLHGITSHLSSGNLDDLVAYLESL